MARTTLVWFHRDLRLADHPALYHAAQQGSVIPVFIWAPDEEAPWSPGAASRWYLHHSLASLDADLNKLGSRLTVRKGKSHDTLRSLIESTGADAVYWNRRSEPALRKRDSEIEHAFQTDGIEVELFNADLFFEPDFIKTQSDTVYRVFTPFWKRCLDQSYHIPPPCPAPEMIASPEQKPDSIPLSALELLPKIDWAEGIRETWTPGEAAARVTWQNFLDSGIETYHQTRNLPAKSGTSRLSPALHFGEISPRKLWVDLKDRMHASKGVRTYLSELGWREFSYYLLHHFPDVPSEPLRASFADFPWRNDPDGLKAWQKGQTGYPIVDAGMRQLWHTGWMHNRVRMIVASFLVKHLLVPWQEGAAWFWDTLVDADLANNTQGWQWTAGCGADAAPYFRIFNPITQGEKFDPQGRYIRTWVPELSRLPDRYLNKPWSVPDSVLKKAGVVLGQTYPGPIVKHRFARQRALDAYQEMKSRT